MNASVHTAWSADTDILLRRTVDLSPDSPPTLYWAVDNDATIYVNGVLVADVTHENCPVLDEFSVLVPAKLIVDGPDLIAVLVCDRGAYTFFDMRVEDQSPVSTQASSWGWIKSKYR